MTISAKQFCESCRNYFSFLETEFGFREVVVPEETFFPEHLRGYVIRFENKTTAVMMRLEVYELLPTVQLLNLIKLVRGHPEAYSLNELLLHGAPEMDPLRDDFQLPLRQTVDQLLARYAEGLQKVGGDVLSGNFEVFPALKKEREQQLKAPRRPSPPAT